MNEVNTIRDCFILIIGIITSSVLEVKIPIIIYEGLYNNMIRVLIIISPIFISVLINIAIDKIILNYNKNKGDFEVVKK